MHIHTIWFTTQLWVFVFWFFLFFCCLVQSYCVKDYPFAQGTLVGEIDSSAWKGEQGLQDRKLIPDSYRVHLPVKGPIQLSGGGVLAPGHTLRRLPQTHRLGGGGAGSSWSTEGESSGGCCPSLMLLGRWQSNSSLCLHGHGAFSLYVCIQIFLL